MQQASDSDVTGSQGSHRSLRSAGSDGSAREPKGLLARKALECEEPDSPGPGRSSPHEQQLVLDNLLAAENDVAELLREFPRTPSARHCSATEAEAVMQRVRKQAARILQPVPASADAEGWVPPTLELRSRVEQLLRGKLVAKMLASRLRRLVDTEPNSRLAPRLVAAEQQLVTLRTQLRSCLEDAMLELRRQVDELVPPTSEEDETPRTR